MKKKKHILDKVFASLLILAILIPASVQFLHLFKNHEHTACKEIAVHLHEKKIDCTIQNFTFSAFHFEINRFNKKIQIHTFLNPETPFESLSQQSFHLHFRLRGPPSKA